MELGAQWIKALSNGRCFETFFQQAVDGDLDFSKNITAIFKLNLESFYIKLVLNADWIKKELGTHSYFIIVIP